MRRVEHVKLLACCVAAVGLAVTVCGCGDFFDGPRRRPAGTTISAQLPGGRRVQVKVVYEFETERSLNGDGGYLLVASPLAGREGDLLGVVSSGGAWRKGPIPPAEKRHLDWLEDSWWGYWNPPASALTTAKFRTLAASGSVYYAKNVFETDWIGNVTLWIYDPEEKRLYCLNGDT